MSVLTAEDIRHPVWHKIKRHLEGEIDRLRAKNDDGDANMSHDDTLSLRAEIRAVKKLLRLGEIHTVEDEPNY